MRKTEYEQYLQGSHWQTLRKEILAEQSECERCSMPRWLAGIAYDQDLHVHHKNYKNLGDEDADDLEVLCLRCHEIETFGRSELRAPKSATCVLCRAIHWDPRAELCHICDSVLCAPYLWHVHDLPWDFSGPTVGDYIIWSIQRAMKAKKDDGSSEF